MSKAWETTRGWQMPAPGQHKICKCPTPGTDGASKCQALARGWGGGGVGLGWAEQELTDALVSICHDMKLLTVRQN